MLTYARDAEKTSKPWRLWEYKNESMNTWIPLNSHPTWARNTEYRHIQKKPRVSEQEAMESLSYHINNDAGYASRWQSNIVRQILGSGITDDPEICNEIALAFMQRVFDYDRPNKPRVRRIKDLARELGLRPEDRNKGFIP